MLGNLGGCDALKRRAAALRDRKGGTIMQYRGLRASARVLLVLVMGAMVIFNTPAYAQTDGQKQIVKEDNKYIYQGQEIKSAGQLKPIVADYPDAAAEAGKAETYAGLAYVSALVGGGLIGWPVGEAIADKEDPKWVLAGAGAGLVLVAVLCGVSSNTHFENSVELYNGHTTAASRSGLGRFQLAIGLDRVSLIVRF